MDETNLLDLAGQLKGADGASATELAETAREELRRRPVPGRIRREVANASPKHQLGDIRANLKSGQALLLTTSAKGGETTVISVAMRTGVEVVNGRTTLVAPPAGVSRETAQEIENAILGLQQALAGRDRGLGFATGRRFEVTLPPEFSADRLTGDSLGASVCIALLSCLSDVPPKHDVAITASVRRNGGLDRVEIGHKTDALARDWPDVRELVVSAGQPSIAQSGLTARECTTILDAARWLFDDFENAVARLPAAAALTGREVGSGATGRVFRMYRNDGEYAYKLFRADTDQHRFRREVETLKAIQHQNVVRFIDGGVDPVSGSPYLLMELVDGETLAARIKGTRGLEIQLAIRYAVQILRGLEALHAKDIVHRDIKPANVMIDRGTDEAKIVDFGSTFVESQTRYTQNVAIGTMGYWAPEQRDGKRPKVQTDIFAVGRTLHALITAEDPPQQRLTGPAALAAVVAKATANAKDDRYQSAREMASALEAVARDLPSNATVSTRASDAPSSRSPTVTAARGEGPGSVGRSTNSLSTAANRTPEAGIAAASQPSLEPRAQAAPTRRSATWDGRRLLLTGLIAAIGITTLAVAKQLYSTAFEEPSGPASRVSAVAPAAPVHGLDPSSVAAPARPVEPTPVQLAVARGTPTSFTLLVPDLLWIERVGTGGVLRRVSTTGGIPRDIVEFRDGPGGALTCKGTVCYWSAGNVIYAASGDLTNPFVYVPDAGGPLVIRVDDDGGWLWWTTGAGELRRAPPWEEPAPPLPVAGETVVRGIDRPGRMRAWQGRPYWASGGSEPTSGRISMLDVGTATVTTVVGLLTRPVAFDLQFGSLYVTVGGTPGSGDGSLIRVDPPSASPTVLYGRMESPCGLTVTSQYVFWSTDTDDGEIWMAPRGGGDKQRLARGQPHPIFVRTEPGWLYWLNEGSATQRGGIVAFAL